MKTVSGQVVSTKPVSLSQAVRTISAFVAADDSGASQAVAAYLRRTSASFNELVQFHKACKLKKIKEEDRVKIGQKGKLDSEEKVEGKKDKRKKNKEGVERGCFGVEKKIEGSLGNGEKEEEVNVKDGGRKKERMKKGEDVEGGSVGNLGVKKNIEGSLGNGKKDEEVNVNVKDGGRRKKDRMKKAEDLEREIEGNLGIKEEGKKKKRKSEAVDEGEFGNSTEQSGHKKKKRRRVEG